MTVNLYAIRWRPVKLPTYFAVGSLYSCTQQYGNTRRASESPVGCRRTPFGPKIPPKFQLFLKTRNLWNPITAILKSLGCVAVGIKSQNFHVKTAKTTF